MLEGFEAGQDFDCLSVCPGGGGIALVFSQVRFGCKEDPVRIFHMAVERRTRSHCLLHFGGDLARRSGSNDFAMADSRGG